LGLCATHDFNGLHIIKLNKGEFSRDSRVIEPDYENLCGTLDGISTNPWNPKFIYWCIENDFIACQNRRKFKLEMCCGAFLAPICHKVFVS
jgi:hypothetical protein